MLIGNVGGEVKIHRFDSDNLIGRLSLATSESYISKETGQRVDQTEWHNLVVKNRLAEVFEKYVKKGDKICVEGKLKSRKWTDQNGQERFTVEIIVSDFTFLSSKGSSQNMGNGNQQNDEPKTTESEAFDAKGDEETPF